MSTTQSPDLRKEPSLTSHESSFNDDKKESHVDVIDVLPPTTGTSRVELVAANISPKQKFALYSSFALLSFFMSLDQYTAGTYLATATSVSFKAHSALAAIRTVRAVFQSVSQPPIAKLSDVLGRKEAYMTSIAFYVVGYIIVASSQSIYSYGVGNSIYIIGITGLFLLQAIIIADISSLRNRLFWSIFPSIPGTINVWLAGTVASKFLLANNSAPNNWRWGYGMSAILIPVLALPIIFTLWYGERKGMKQIAAQNKHDAESTEAIAQIAEAAPTTTWQSRWTQYFHELDVIGLLLMIAAAGMVLITITTANAVGSSWGSAQSICLLVFGVVCAISFVFWEKYGARHPLIPFFLLSNRTVIAGFAIAVFSPCAGGIASNYFYTFLVVSANQTVLSATRITGLTSFASILMCASAGVLVRYTRRLKPIIFAGFVLNILGLGLMIRFRSQDNTQGELAMSQVIRGMGTGMIGFPIQTAVQSMTRHEHVAAITAGYLTVFYLSGGIGAAIGGAIWSNTLQTRLADKLGNATLAASVYANPLSYVISNPNPLSFERMAISQSYNEVQRILLITATCLAAIGFICSFFIHNVRLPDEQSLEGDKLDEINGVTKKSNPVAESS